ncbi:MAG TPA: FHA domain-containing protein [Pseudonocardia sp.]|nr:FHA domain-containing protein [Pseudonocardia sp.]
MSRHTAQLSPVDHTTSGLAGLGTVVTVPPAQSEESEIALDPTSGSLSGSAGPGLHVTRGPEAGRRFELVTGAASIIGRHPECGVVLPDVTVSRRHAEIRSSGDGFVLVDCGSLNGTYVNRQPVDTVTLSDGDEIAIGVARLRFSAGS